MSSRPTSADSPRATPAENAAAAAGGDVAGDGGGSSPAATLRSCPRCGAPLRGGGLAAAPCVSCLLLAGLEVEEPLEPPLTSAEGEAGDDGFSDVPKETPEPPATNLGLQLGGHVLVRELGRGSMGVIYEARQFGTKRRVALKTIAHGLLLDADANAASEANQVRARFRREAEAAASLDHPHVLPIYEVGEDAGRPFFTMKLATGGSLLPALPRYAGRPREAVALLAKVARGVAHAHARGVLHRDLKPGNILLDADGETPLVGDFGLARWLERESDCLTQSLVVFGTPGYMAPEQARQAGTAGPAADIYSLGAILFQLLCGQTPFQGKHALDVIEQAAAGPAPPLRTFNPKASRDLETICARCLEIEPERRPRSAADLAEDLERWLEGQSIRARPVRPPERVWRWTRRNPWLAATAAGCLLLAVVAGTRHQNSVRLEATLQQEALARATVAVLPLEDLGAIDTPSTLAAKFDSVLQSQLARLPNLRFVPTKVAPGGDEGWPAAWQRAGQEAHAPTVLSGTVRHRGEKGDEQFLGLRVVLRLAATMDGRVLSRRVLDLSADDTETVTGAVADLAREVHRVEEPPPESGEFTSATTNTEARDCLRSGKEIFLRSNPNDLPQCIALFQRAAQIDPSCAEAHAWLASACVARGWVEPGQGWSGKARASAVEALRLDSWQAEARRALGVALRQERRFLAATNEILTAYELDPTEPRHAHLVGLQWQSLGHPVLALKWFERAERRQVHPGIYAGHMGNLWLDLADDAAAAACYRKSTEFRPGATEGSLGLVRLWLLQGKFKEARGRCCQLAAQYPDYQIVRMMLAEVEFFSRDFPAAEVCYRDLVANDRTGGENFCGGVGHLCALGYLRRRAGDETGGRALLEEARQQAIHGLQETPGDSRQCYALATACAALGEIVPALDALERAVAAGWLDYRSPALDPRFDILAGEPRFQQCLSRLVAHVAALRRQWPAEPPADNQKTIRKN